MVNFVLRTLSLKKLLCILLAIASILSLCGFTFIDESIDIPEEWIEAGARVMIGEARGVENELEIRATLLVALNRTMDIRWSDDLVKVIYEPNQFAPWSGPVGQEWLDLSRNTIENWYLHWDDFYILPKDYFFFAGDGKRNHFRKEYSSNTYWNWGNEP